MMKIFTTKPEKVAIDLRLNRGGDGTLITPLIRSLIQCEEIDRKGRLFAIIGRATFSAAQMLADAREKYRRDAIAPQIPAALTAADYANNVDPALDAIKSR